MPWELDPQEVGDILALHCEIHLLFHFINQGIKGSTIFSKPKAVIHISEADGCLVNKQTGVNVQELLESNTLQVLLEQSKEH